VTIVRSSALVSGCGLIEAAALRIPGGVDILKLRRTIEQYNDPLRHNPTSLQIDFLIDLRSGCFAKA